MSMMIYSFFFLALSKEIAPNIAVNSDVDARYTLSLNQLQNDGKRELLDISALSTIPLMKKDLTLS